VTTSGGDSYADIAGVLDGDWHLVTWMVAPAEGKIYKVKDQVLLGHDALAVGDGLTNTAYLNLGLSAIFDLDYFKYEGRVLPAEEYGNAWDIVRGNTNGSAYPEAGHGLGQYWAFLRLAQYFFATNDPAAWEILDHWLTWLDTYGMAAGSGWQFPLHFSEYGFTYGPPGSYDPGAGASLALGCLYVYLRNGHATAATWARRILDDLRLNRPGADFGGGYKSDYHYAWLNGLVAQAFGLAAQGLTGQAYPFPSIPEDAAHFEALLNWLFTHAGDVKPNILNSQLIPYIYCEAVDVWDYAPHYLSQRQMGSLEAVVMMLGAALEQGKAQGDWVWFDGLLRFILLDNLVRLNPSQTRSLNTSYHLTGAKNLVRLRYADYDQDNTKYAETRETAAINTWGERAVDLDFRYGSPVILENPDIAGLLASRLLKRLSTPWELLELETWLEGLRLEVGDSLALSSDFHGLDQEEFTVFGKTIDLKKRQVRLNLGRPLNYSWAWAVETAGSNFDNYAIDQASPYDANWTFRAFAG